MEKLVYGMNITRIRTPLMTDLEQPSCPPGCLDHGAGLVQAIGHLFFTVHGEAMIKTGICLFGMNPVGRGNNDRIQVFLAV